MKHGWLTEDFETYIGKKENLGSTDFRRLLKSRRHFKEQLGGPSMETSLTGNIAHCAFLEPTRFRREVRLAPQVHKGRTEGKTEWMNFLSSLYDEGVLNEHPKNIEGKGINQKLTYIHENNLLDKRCIILDKSNHDMVQGIHETLKRKPKVKAAFKGVHEKSGYTALDVSQLTDPLLVKIRPDVKNKNEGYMADLKTVDDCLEFEKHIYKFGYDLQAYLYLLVGNFLDNNAYHTFKWIAVEKKPPCEAMLYYMHLGDECFNVGMSKFEKALTVYNDGLISGEWPGYPEEKDVEVPEWILRKYGLSEQAIVA